ncbi:MAG: prepilin-type N-terminal cleavage/methylation domain-containing protein [Synergistaceae bacterium]|jgi:prepilin-type N-terminal cleavage/methylation domain-containing protein|nr:prepilin-type N-terminal cleavage/methylation domain-containing protein [Synergistaceae bacterium]
MTPRKTRRGFTLIEVMIVVAILALMAVMTLPKGLSLEPPLRALRRAVTEAAALALDGQSVRLRLESENGADRGKIVLEALLAATSGQPGDAPEWKLAEVKYPLEGEGWSLSPEIVYFYSDGTCTPARLTYAAKGVRLADGDSAFLTVTGFLFEAR